MTMTIRDLANCFPTLPRADKKETFFDASPFGFDDEYFLCSDVYADDQYEYFHMHIPREVVKYMPFGYLLSPQELSLLCGVRINEGWEHYTHCRSQPHVIPMRRLRPRDSPYAHRYAALLAMPLAPAAPVAADAALPHAARKRPAPNDPVVAQAARTLMHARNDDSGTVLGVLRAIQAPVPTNTLEKPTH